MHITCHQYYSLWHSYAPNMLVVQNNLFIISESCSYTSQAILKIHYDLQISTNMFHYPSNMPPSNVHKYANPIDCSNTIYNTKYKIVVLKALRNTLGRFTEVSPDLNTQLNNYLNYWPNILHAMYRNISKMVDQSQPISHRMHCLPLIVTLIGSINCYLKLWEFLMPTQQNIYTILDYTHILKMVIYTWKTLGNVLNWKLCRQLQPWI